MNAPRASSPASDAGVAPMREMLLSLERLHKQLTNTIDRVLLPEGLNLAEWLIVSELGVAGESTLSRIASRLSRDAGALSRAITRLSQRKLLESNRNGRDRRRATLSLTAQGHVLHERVALAFERMAQPVPEARSIERLLRLFAVPGRPAASRPTAAKVRGRTSLKPGSHAAIQDDAP